MYGSMSVYIEDVKVASPDFSYFFSVPRRRKRMHTASDANVPVLSRLSFNIGLPIFQRTYTPRSLLDRCYRLCVNHPIKPPFGFFHPRPFLPQDHFSSFIKKYERSRYVWVCIYYSDYTVLQCLHVNIDKNFFQISFFQPAVKKLRQNCLLSFFHSLHCFVLLLNTRQSLRRLKSFPNMKIHVSSNHENIIDANYATSFHGPVIIIRQLLKYATILYSFRLDFSRHIRIYVFPHASRFVWKAENPSSALLLSLSLYDEIYVAFPMLDFRQVPRFDALPFSASDVLTTREPKKPKWSNSWIYLDVGSTLRTFLYTRVCSLYSLYDHISAAGERKTRKLSLCCRFKIFCFVVLLLEYQKFNAFHHIFDRFLGDDKTTQILNWLGLQNQRNTIHAAPNISEKLFIDSIDRTWLTNIFCSFIAKSSRGQYNCRVEK